MTIQEIQALTPEQRNIKIAGDDGGERMSGRVYLDFGRKWKVGDPCPEGYVDRQEWAEAHYKAGLKQLECGRCSRWMFPHELSEIKDSMNAKTKFGELVKIESAVCLECAKPKLTQ